ncbi:cupin domain-containing protein [Corallococcus terminator]|uniref:Cupin domain-containing protein n=1 Tax=Corallococcus terminator TaxID=2316733 RepID=A0A3A8IHS6_9BACT|nr:cupin domain-containing protein [Corallococcus terminator]RKG77063.1 cupin domain-containing protein [Corallococcus terminator]
MSSSHLVHAEDLPWTEVAHGTRVALKRKQLGAAAHGRKLGCSLVELPPGRRSWPLHYHLANEEALYFLAGAGTLRLGSEEVPVREGDYVALPPGAGTAHQLINSGTEPLRYLCFSTMEEPDVLVYPDSKKVGIMAGAAPGGDKASRTLHVNLPLAASVDYWDGEEP